MRSSSHKASLWAAVFLALSAFLFFFFCSELPIIAYQYGAITYSDFAYHMVILREFWSGNAARIYSPATQLEVVHRVFGPELREAMPIGILPSALVLWMPFAALSERSIELAAAVWCALSLTVFLASVLEAVNEFPQRRKLRLLVLAILPLALPLGIRALMLGQTSLFGAGVLVFLLLSLIRPHGGGMLRMALLAILLALKPAYALVGFGALAAARQWRALAGAALGLGVLSASALIVGGADMISDYVESLRLYSSGVVPDYYRHAINSQKMNILSSTALRQLGQEHITRLSSVIYLSFSAIVIVFSLRSRQVSERVITGVTFLLVAIFLLFAPYLGSYEELFFWPLCAAVVVRSQLPGGRAPEDALLSTAILLFLQGIAVAGTFLWLVKAAVIGIAMRGLKRT